MATYTFSAYDLNALVIDGDDPFLYTSERNADALEQSMIYVEGDTSSGGVGGMVFPDLPPEPSEPTVLVTVTDDDTHASDPAHETGGAATLSDELTIMGTTYPAGSVVSFEYSYVLTPLFGMPEDEITIYVMTINGDVVGFASSAPLEPDTPYFIGSGGSDQPHVPYTNLAVVCFEAGTLIATPRGEVAIRDLAPGDLVLTRDNGAQPLAWAGGMCVAGRGNAAPVRIRAGTFGATRDLIVSQQHRLLLRHGAEECLVAAKALIDGRTILRESRPRVRYIHLMTERHEVIIANGVAAETLLPGPMALSWLAPRDRARVAGIAGDGPYPAARPIIKPGRWKRLVTPRGRDMRAPGLPSPVPDHGAPRQPWEGR